MNGAKVSVKTNIWASFCLAILLTLPATSMANLIGEEPRKPKQKTLPFKTSFDPICFGLLTRIFEAPIPQTLRSIVEFEYIRKVELPPKQHRSFELGRATRAKNILGQALSESIEATREVNEPWGWVELVPSKHLDEVTLQTLRKRYISFVYTSATGNQGIDISSRILSGKVVKIEGFRHTEGFPDAEPHDFRITLERPTGETVFGTPIQEEFLLSKMSPLFALLPLPSQSKTGISALDSFASHSIPTSRFQKFYFIFQQFEAEQTEAVLGFAARFDSALRIERGRGHNWKKIAVTNNTPRPQYDFGESSPRDFFKGKLVLGTWHRQLRKKDSAGVYLNEIFLGEVKDVLPSGFNPINNKEFVLVIQGPFGQQEILFGDSFYQGPKNLHIL